MSVATGVKPISVLVVAVLTATSLAWGVPAAATGALEGSQVRTVVRQYGDGPVRLGTARVLKIRFDGGRGDRVRLAGTSRCPVSLRGPAGENVSRLPVGFWRLGDRGRHTFTLTRCDVLPNRSKIQLEKLRYLPVPTNGPGVQLPADRGFVDAVRVRVPASGTLQVKALRKEGSEGSVVGMVLPQGNWYRFNGLVGGETLFLEDGRPIATPFGRLRGAGGGGALVVHAGDRVTLVTAGKLRVFKSVAKPVTVAVDGPAVELAPSEVPYREYQVELDAVAGSWLHPEIVGPTGGLYDSPRLVGPNGHLFLRTSYWRIPATGRYRLMVPTAPTTETTQVRIRTIRQLATPMPVDGTHLTMTTSEPGEWVLAPMTLGEGLYRLSSHSAAATGDWAAEATLQPELNCPRRSLGCGMYSSSTVSPSQPTSVEPFGGYGAPETPWMVLLRPSPGVTASVELSVTPVG